MSLKSGRTVLGCLVVAGLVTLGTLDSTSSAAPPSCSPFPCVPPPDGPGLDDSEAEPNNFFFNRTMLQGSSRCNWERRWFARLGPADTGNPDTVLAIICGPIATSAPAPAGTFDASEDAKTQAVQWRAEFGGGSAVGSADRGVNVNDDGGPWRRWGGSALTFISCAGTVFDLIVTGKGCNPLSTLPCTHSQTGLYEVIINYFDSQGVFISTRCFRSLLSSTDRDLFNMNAPVNTFDFDVFINPLADYHGDVDYFQVNGLRPNEEYFVSTTGLLSILDPFFGGTVERTLDTVLTQHNSAGTIIGTNDDIGAVGSAPNIWWNRNSRLKVVADASGTIYIAVSGWGDFNADGRIDPDNACLHRENGWYRLRVAHRCDIGCLDLNGSCVVDFGDITVILANWLRTCQ